MANLTNDRLVEVLIPSAHPLEAYTEYKIQVTIESVTWIVGHRYNDFVDLHEKLVSNHGLARDLLPPKKLIGNKDPVFIETRRKDLQLYLQTILNFLQHVFPKELADFLEMKEYEVSNLLQCMAKEFFQHGEELLVKGESVDFSPLQLHAISHCLKNAMPQTAEQEYHLTHVVDFASHLEHLCITGNDKPFKTSNIIFNELDYDLNAFKSLKTLVIKDANVAKICQIGTLRGTVGKVSVHRSGMTKIGDMLMCDSLYKHVLGNIDTSKWSQLTDLDLSENSICEIDLSISLAQNVTRLNLSNNQLMHIESLTKLPKLVSLNLSHNKFSELQDLHTRLGNVQHLDLSHNQLRTLDGLGKLYSLVSLDASYNLVEGINQVASVVRLPCIEQLILNGNPVASVVDYRTKVLEQSGTRASEICLDSEKPTQRELDTVAVLQAIRSAREGRLPKLNLAKPAVVTTPKLQGSASKSTQPSLNSSTKIPSSMERLPTENRSGHRFKLPQM
ncbi:nischarin-like [Oratosquilla oratoria]|uniref:nischarin-like n=1 Tax=Oratosquilla oratoria TaxID=337810 RepID=UPI003F77519B